MATLFSEKSFCKQCYIILLAKLTRKKSQGRDYNDWGEVFNISTYANNGNNAIYRPGLNYIEVVIDSFSCSCLNSSYRNNDRWSVNIDERRLRFIENKTDRKKRFFDEKRYNEAIPLAACQFFTFFLFCALFCL